MQRPAIHACLVASMLASCGSHELPPRQVDGADARRGRAAMEQFDCGVCHAIPGVRGAVGRVGPALRGYAGRPYVAGKFAGDATHLVRWIQDAPALAPRTAMPALGASEQQARDMAAYLYTLR